MRKFLWFSFATLAAIVLVGLAAAFAIDWSGSLDGVSVTIDGDAIETSAITAAIGIGVSVAVLAACVLLVGVLASIVVLVPIAIVVALLFGLAPLAIPVLLGVGAYVLLARLRRRRPPPPPAATLPNA